LLIYNISEAGQAWKAGILVETAVGFKVFSAPWAVKRAVWPIVPEALRGALPTPFRDVSKPIA
jgi:hypothetical protein